MTDARGVRMAATCSRAISIRYVINVSRESIHGRLPSSPCIVITPLSLYTHPTSINITTMSVPEPTGVRQRGAPLEEHKNPYVINHESRKSSLRMTISLFNTPTDMLVIPSL